MLFTDQDTLTEIWQAIRSELLRTNHDRKHPFRYGVLSTQDQSVHSRYVVLRQVSQELQLFLYTDLRAGKVAQIRENPQVQMLFYHPSKRVQLIVAGLAMLHHQNEVSTQHWPRVQGEARKSYSSTKAPGTVVPSPAAAHEWQDEDNPQHFAVVTIDPDELEVLQLDRQHHLRARFRSSSEWAGEWLVP